MCSNAVDFTENRDSVQFQYQEIHELFGDSFQFTECLKNLTQKFDYDKNLLAEYDKVVKKEKANNIWSRSSYIKIQLKRIILKISLHPEDSNVVGFLWLKNEEDIDFDNFD